MNWFYEGAWRAFAATSVAAFLAVAALAPQARAGEDDDSGIITITKWEVCKLAPSQDPNSTACVKNAICFFRWNECHDYSSPYDPSSCCYIAT